MWRTLPPHKRDARAAVRRTRKERMTLADESSRRNDGRLLAAALAERLREHRPGTLAAFRSLRSEPPTTAAIEAARDLGWRVIVPVLLPDKDLDWQEWPASDRLLGRQAIGAASVILVPALAIDRQGMRLGQGGGSYDRVLARRAQAAWTVAVVHDDEVVERVPRDRHDLPVDAVITPRRGVIDLPLREADPGAGQVT